MPQSSHKRLISGQPGSGNQPAPSQGSPTLKTAAAGLPTEQVLYPRQEKLLQETWDKPSQAIFWEPRLGKTPPTILTAQYLWEHNKIDAVLLLAPNPLHLNWAENEIPTWIPNAEVYEWLSDKKKYPPLWDSKPDQLRPVIFFCLNIEAIQNLELQEYLKNFVQRYKTMIIIDESHHLKSTRFKRTDKNKKPRARIVRELAQKCPYRRILTGTPSPNGPFDFWSQFYILDPMILGPSSTKFKARYGIFEQEYFQGRSVPVCKGYQNQAELSDKMAPYTSWMSWGPEMPKPKHQKQFFEMTPRQQKLYSQLETEFYITLNNEPFLVDHVLTRLLRLHQLARGFFEGKAIAPLCALEALTQIIDPKEKTIVWCHFKPELEVLVKNIQQPYIAINSQVPQSERLHLVKAFNTSKNINLLLSSPSLIGEGTDISNATHMIFYSNSYQLQERQQALFRFQGDKQKSDNLTVTDLVASRSVDLKCLKRLEQKKDVAEFFKKNPSATVGGDT